MGRRNDIEDPRRWMLVAALAAGFFGLRSGPLPAQGEALPEPLQAGRSIHELRGDVRVNGQPATMQTMIRARDAVEIRESSRAIPAVGKDAFLLRASGRLEIKGEGDTARALRLVTGKLLSVFGRGRHGEETTTASIGIRGTGLYVESDPELSYVCTCYGTTELASISDPESKETVVSEHHDEPRYTLASGSPGNRIRLAPVFNHTDQQLALIEALVEESHPSR